jgi:aryl-alcohol dehydrogenase-like predicted oxidoreductase
MLTRKLGQHGPVTSAIGLGCMGMSDLYGPSDRAAGIATIHAALQSCVTLLDTGDFYGMGHNELLISEALKNVSREQYYLSVKFGALRDPFGNWSGFDGRPAAVKNFLAYSRKRLNVDYVDIYRPARLDPHVPIEETIGAIAELVKKGCVRFIGLSEVGSDTIRRAASVHPISDLQIEYAVTSRSIEQSILPTCRELGIAITAYGVLGRGLLSGKWRPEQSSRAGDIRSFIPRLQGQNLKENMALLDVLGEVALRHGKSLTQIAIAWVLSRGSDITPIIGSRHPDQLKEVMGALDINFNSNDYEILDKIADLVRGTRYAAAHMAHLDSERG